MSPVSRNRKRKKNSGKAARSTRWLGPPGLGDLQGRFGELGDCDCPACTSPDFDPDSLVEDLVESSSELADALDAELAGASLVRLGAVIGEGFEEVFALGLVPAIESRGGSAALATLLMIGSIARRQLGVAASAAVDRLVAAGVAGPQWADELAQPLVVTDCRRLCVPDGSGSMLLCSFRRAGREHSFLVIVNHLDCGAAADVLLLGHDQMAGMLESLRSGFGIEAVEEALEPAELRWQVENALDARAHHDIDAGQLGLAELFTDPDDESENYPAMAELLRFRMLTLPAPSKPRAPHPHGAVGSPALFPIDDDDLFGPPPTRARRKRGTRLPAKRASSAKTKPIYQIKVGLRGAKPPIWRRLEVPADVSLATLHSIIQLAFGWGGGHLHVFNTPSGDYGVEDGQLGCQQEDRVTLAQVMPAVGDTIRYTYDFGDDWEHDILVEKVLDRDDTVGYPRCTAGRRACPPEDCGGIWAYAELLETLADPSHQDRQEMMDWLGLDDPADFDPAWFDAAEVSQALARLR